MTTLQIRTRDNLLDLLLKGQSADWKVGQGKEQEITYVEIVNFAGSQRIEAKFDPENSYRLDNGRLVVAFTDGRIVNCQVSFDAQNSL
ncbi:MAG: hypothetical protein AAGA67_14850, partial [Cyanobacteria bacterium P01_F01_bin.153]